MSRLEIMAAFTALPKYRRCQAMRMACRDAIEVWRRYRADGKPLEYFDGVVGMHHAVDDTLPQRALDDLDRWLRGEPVDPRPTDTAYAEPIVAMQDDDLDFPDEVEQAYYAIYNLHRIVFEIPIPPEDHVVLSQVASAVDVELDDWVREWWTRVWDAWASEPELPYEPSPMTEPVFRALCEGNVRAAIDAISDGGQSCLRAVLLAIAGRRDAAITIAGRATGADVSDPTVRRWFEDHIFTLVPEAIAVAPRMETFAVISNDRLEICELAAGGVARTATFPGRHLRQVRFFEDAVWVAGDRLDRIGVWAAFWDGGGLQSRSREVRNEVHGRRVIAALGPNWIIARHETDVVVIDSRWDPLGPAKVCDAAVSADGRFIATHDGARVSIWDRDDGTVMVLESERTPRRLVIGGAQVLVLWAGGSATLHDLTG